MPKGRTSCNSENIASGRTFWTYYMLSNATFKRYRIRKNILGLKSFFVLTPYNPVKQYAVIGIQTFKKCQRHAKRQNEL